MILEEAEDKAFKNPYESEQFDEDEVIDLTPSQPTHEQPTFQKQLKLSSVQPGQNPDLYQEGSSIFMREEDQLPTTGTNLNEDGDPPLLEDIGIDPSLIWEKVKTIIIIDRPYQVYIDQPDLTGPILIALLFGMELLALGKVGFGDIYAMFITGNCLAYTLFNLMTQKQHISLYSIMSILGYGLLPMLLLGPLGIFVSLKKQIGIIAGLLLALWSALSASNYIELMIGGFQRRSLIVYPLILFYVCFLMITIF